MMHGYSDKVVTVKELRKILEKIERIDPDSHICFGSIEDMFTTEPRKIKLATMIAHTEESVTIFFEDEDKEGLIK